MSSTEHLRLCRKLLGLLIRVQRQNRFIATSPSPALGLFESHVLFELQAQSDLGVKELASLLMVNQGNLSRTLRRLEKGGWLRRSGGSYGSRRLIFAPSADAIDVLRHIDGLADEQIFRSLHSLSAQQRSDIYGLYAKLCTGFKAPNTRPRAHEHKLRHLQRRAARTLGMLGSNAYFSGLSSPAFHVLSLLSQLLSPVSSSALAQHLGIQQSYISRISASLIRKKILHKELAKVDQRLSLLNITAAGRDEAARIESSAAKNLSGALQGVTARELATLVDSYEAYALNGEKMQARSHSITQHCGDKSALRAFIVRQAVRLNRAELLPPLICAADSATYVTKQDKTHLFAAHFLRSSGASTLSCIAWAQQLDYSPLREELLKSSCEIEQNQVNRVDFSKAALYLS